MAPEHPEPVEIADRGEAAVLPSAVTVFEGGFRKVHMDPEAVFQGEVVGPEDVLFGYGIDGMDAYGKAVAVVPFFASLIQSLAGKPLFSGRFPVVAVEEKEGDYRPDSKFEGRPPRFGGEPVMVIETGRAAFYHLETGQTACLIDEIPVYDSLYFPYPFKPVIEPKVFVDAAEKDHRGVTVHIDKAGNKGLAPSVENFRSLRRDYGLGTDTANAFSFNENVFFQPVYLYVFDQYHSRQGTKKPAQSAGLVLKFIEINIRTA